MAATKVFMLLGTLALVAGKAEALVDVSTFGGFSTFQMTEYNANVNSAATSARSFGAIVSNNSVQSGFYVGGEVGFTPASGHLT